MKHRHYQNKPGGLRSMRRIPVALTPQESNALNWLQRYAREDQLPKRFRPLRKLALHLIIKALNTSDLCALVAYHASAEPLPLTPTP